MLYKHRNVFVDNLDHSTITGIPEFHVKLKPNVVWNGIKPRPMSLPKKEWVSIWLEKRLKEGIIRKSDDDTGPTSPLLLVNKPNENGDKSPNFRATIDTSALSPLFEDIRGFMPLQKDVLQKMSGKLFHSNFDMKDMFFQLKCSEETGKNYAFSTPFGNFNWNGVLPQGDKNIPVFANNVMNKILFDAREHTISFYDDITTSSNTLDEHIKDIDQMLGLLDKHNAKLSFKKTRVAYTAAESMGFTFSNNKFKPKDLSTEKFINAPFPTKDNLKSWFGLLNVFRDFIPNLQHIEAAFQLARKKDSEWIVTEEMKDAFEQAKVMVANVPLMAFPDDSKPLYLDTDASMVGTGGFLYQEELKSNGAIAKIPIRYTSHVFSEPARKWSTTDQEAFGIIKSIMSFEHILLGRPFIIRTDHNNLIHMSQSKSPRVTRWFTYISQFEYSIEHIKGVDNTVADPLSRIFENSINSCDSMGPDVLMADPTLDRDAIEERELDVIEAIPDNIEEINKIISTIFNDLHAPKIGHPNIADTIDGIKNRIKTDHVDLVVSYNHLKQQVITLLTLCMPCVKTRLERKNKKLEYHTVANFKPFETFQADVITGLSKTAGFEGYTKVMVFVCAFSRFTILFPLSNETAEEVSYLLLQVHGIFGTPRFLVSDGAPAFISKGFEQCCKLLGIKHNVTHPYHPEAHGIVERENREVIDKLRKVLISFLQASGTNWHRYLPVAMRQINAHTHSALGLSPYELIFGSKLAKDMKMFQTDEPFTDYTKLVNPPEYVRKFNESLSIIYSHGLANLEDKIIARHEKASNTEEKYAVGELIMYRNLRIYSDKKKKVSPTILGPFKVERILQGDFYHVKDLVQDKLFFSHAKDMIKFSPKISDQEALELAAKDHEEHVIESVISHIGEAKTLTDLKFLVKFLNIEEPSYVRFKDGKYVTKVQNYIRNHMATDFPKLSKLFAEVLPQRRSTKSTVDPAFAYEK